MLLQALHAETEVKNLSFQVMLLVQKGGGTRSHHTTPLFLRTKSALNAPL